MHGYLMFSKILVCQVVPADEVHPNTFKNSSKPYRQINWVSRERERHNKVRGAHGNGARAAGAGRRATSSAARRALTRTNRRLLLHRKPVLAVSPHAHAASASLASR